MAKFLLGAAATTIAATAIFATSAHAIEDMAKCMSEGGSAFDMSGTQVCLVPMRDAEWSDPVYDGNQLGIIECSGKTISGGKWCLEPFGDNVLPTPAAATPPTPTPDSSAVVDTVVDTAVDTAKDAVMDAGTEMVQDAVETAVEGSGL